MKMGCGYLPVTVAPVEISMPDIAGVCIPGKMVFEKIMARASECYTAFRASEPFFAGHEARTRLDRVICDYDAESCSCDREVLIYDECTG